MHANLNAPHFRLTATLVCFTSRVLFRFSLAVPESTITMHTTSFQIMDLAPKISQKLFGYGTGFLAPFPTLCARGKHLPGTMVTARKNNSMLIECVCRYHCCSGFWRMVEESIMPCVVNGACSNACARIHSPGGYGSSCVSA